MYNLFYYIYTIDEYLFYNILDKVINNIEFCQHRNIAFSYNGYEKTIQINDFLKKCKRYKKIRIFNFIENFKFFPYDLMRIIYKGHYHKLIWEWDKIKLIPYYNNKLIIYPKKYEKIKINLQLYYFLKDMNKIIKENNFFL